MWVQDSARAEAIPARVWPLPSVSSLKPQTFPIRPSETENDDRSGRLETRSAPAKSKRRSPCGHISPFMRPRWTLQGAHRKHTPNASQREIPQSKSDVPERRPSKGCGALRGRWYGEDVPLEEILTDDLIRRIRSHEQHAHQSAPTTALVEWFAAYPSPMAATPKLLLQGELLNASGKEPENEACPLGHRRANSPLPAQALALVFLAPPGYQQGIRNRKQVRRFRLLPGGTKGRPCPWRLSGCRVWPLAGCKCGWNWKTAGTKKGLRHRRNPLNSLW